jgi:Ser/Thr protein kinase RdoA (MazF antagonist)
VAATTGKFQAHGLLGTVEEPDWPRLTLAEVDRLLRRYPAAGGADRLLSFSPRPFSAASVVATAKGERVFVKRHHGAVRDMEGLLEEHRLIAFLAEAEWGGRERLVSPVLADLDGETAIVDGEWTYEVHALAPGVDVYEQALSWTPFLGCGHARAAGRALARLHMAVEGYNAPMREARQLVTSFSIFAGICDEHDPVSRMEAYLKDRPYLRSYVEERKWRLSFEELLLPLYSELRPWLRYLKPLWTHNDFHASNLMWNGDGEDAEITGIIDFGLADRTNAMHDLATAIERNVIEWLRMDEPDTDIVHLDHLDALLSGYEELSPLSYEEARALVAMLPLVHCEFALSETDYFLSVLHSKEKAYLAYEEYFLAHAEWFKRAQGRRLLRHLDRWVTGRPRADGGEL